MFTSTEHKHANKLLRFIARERTLQNSQVMTISYFIRVLDSMEATGTLSSYRAVDKRILVTRGRKSPRIR